MSNSKKKSVIGMRLKQARKERGLSQKELGDMLKLSDKAVSSYEVGRAFPTVDTLKDISRVTYKPLTYFTEEQDNPDIDLQIKLATIERELLEVKKLLLAKEAAAQQSKSKK
jgi:repressor LexA